MLQGVGFAPSMIQLGPSTPCPSEAREPRMSDLRDPFFARHVRFPCKKFGVATIFGDIMLVCSDSVVNIRIKDLKPVIAPAILCEEMEMSSAQVHVIEFHHHRIQSLSIKSLLQISNVLCYKTT